jgi:hypothetical protein
MTLRNDRILEFEEEIIRSHLLRTGFGRGYKPIFRQTAERIN